MPRILSIEDNSANQDLLARYLELFDCEVTMAGDGPGGVASAHELHAELDLILLDMNLPEIDGWETARRLKASDVTRHIPIIAVTAHAMTGDRAKAIAAGCDDYTTKPIDFHVLLNKIEHLTNKAPAP